MDGACSAAPCKGWRHHRGLDGMLGPLFRLARDEQIGKCTCLRGRCIEMREKLEGAPTNRGLQGLA